MKKIILTSVVGVVSLQAFATSPIFVVTPNMAGQSSLISGQTGTAVYQVFNNTSRTLTGVGMAQMPAGVTVNTNAVSPYSDYCSNPFNLAAGASCLLKVNLNSSVTGGPVVCFSQSKPVFCSQPLQPDQLSTTVTSGTIPQDCQSNVANFNYELQQSLDATTGFNSAWGPARNPLSLSPSNPNLTNCPTTAGTSWQQQRVVAAEAYWIAQKLNYCHHYNPDWATPVGHRTPAPAGNAGGYCNPAVDTMPGSVYYGQQARWNYSGKGGETLDNWVNKNRMWYGLDCTNYTAFIYNFALGIQFDSNTGFQAGQTSVGCTGVSPNVCPQDGLSPNIQNTGTTYAPPGQDYSGANAYLNNPNRAGYLVCMDGTIDPNSGPSSTGTPTMCAGHGGYLSSINAQNQFDRPAVTINTLVPNGTPILHPGDILYIAGAGPDHQDQPDGTSSSIATHGIIWTGKQVGYGPNDINPSLIAPDDAPCAAQSIWQPVIGAWVINDSHYQGPDYRVLTQCFYLNDLWGVRRVIN